MKIKGIGTISKEKAMEILTREGRKAVRDGEITTEELAKMYKLQKVKEACTIGTCTDSFNNSYKWVPDELKEELTPEQLGALTEAFYKCYGAGKMIKRGLKPLFFNARKALFKILFFQSVAVRNW